MKLGKEEKRTMWKKMKMNKVKIIGNIEERRKVKKEDSNNENEKAWSVKGRNGDLFIQASGCQLSQDRLYYMERVY